MSPQDLKYHYYSCYDVLCHPLMNELHKKTETEHYFKRVSA